MSITLYEHADFNGRKVILTESNMDLTQIGFNDKASSLKVASGTWIVYQHINYEGRSYQVSAGSYNYGDICGSIGNDVISSVKLISNEICLYEHSGFGGTAMPLTESVPNLVTLGFNDKASSVRVAQGTWTLYEHVNYQGRSMLVTPGSYDIQKIREGLGNDVASSVKQMSCEIILYEHSDFKGMALPLTQSTPNLVDLGFNDKASSIIVVSGTWSVFEHVDYKGKCFTLNKPGTYNYKHLCDGIGNDVISSVRCDSF